MLIDEAEVYLERRLLTDLKQNGLVFKRFVLEDENLANADWIGGEIRNGPAFQTEVLLAEYCFQQKKDKTEDDQLVVNQRDFEHILDMTTQFKRYLVNVHGSTINAGVLS
ncbi:hypothetical protein FHL15_010306 [Xylaria flabelliformis]|uniref:AAA+ ATPase lid domain-containing protein n=1 Tax=Xylaria flabelliformis TaxID=2512241 RepID=A0A553HLQ2_9PEZI|nr:hypothetical protein FHL15_010306 [Xylaria flabelliformis]